MSKKYILSVYHRDGSGAPEIYPRPLSEDDTRLVRFISERKFMEAEMTELEPGIEGGDKDA